MGFPLSPLVPNISVMAFKVEAIDFTLITLKCRHRYGDGVFTIWPHRQYGYAYKYFYKICIINFTLKGSRELLIWTSQDRTHGINFSHVQEPSILEDNHVKLQLVLAYPIISQLKSHLYKGIWTYAALLHKTLSICTVHVNSQVYVIQQAQRYLQDEMKQLYITITTKCRTLNQKKTTRTFYINYNSFEQIMKAEY